jgi:undecaprenyl-diphosphatase
VIIQSGAVLATILFLRKDIVRIVPAFFRGLFDAEVRNGPDFRFAVAVLVGSLPIVVAALLFKDQIETTLRSLWFVAGALIIWSGAMAFADHAATQQRSEKHVNWKDTIIIGVVQCLALIPGISRSGATMSAGLLRDLDRVTVTKLSFFLSIPALTGASVLQGVEEADRISAGVGWTNTIVATVVSFGVAYLSVTWLLRYIARHSYTVFIIYRVVLGLLLVVLLSSNVIEPK